MLGKSSNNPVSWYKVRYLYLIPTQNLGTHLRTAYYVGTYFYLK